MALDYVINPDGTPGKKWNPYKGCRKNLDVCPIWDKCWARSFAKRLSGIIPDVYDPKDPFKPEFLPGRYDEPIKRKKPTAYYVCYMGDLFGEWQFEKPYLNYTEIEIQHILNITRALKRHRFLFLTKRPHNYQRFDFADNSWLGTSINSKEDLERLEHLALVDAQTYIEIEPAINDFSSELHLKILDLIEDYGEQGKPDWAIIGGWSNRDNKDLEDTVMELTYRLSLLDIPIWHKDNLEFGWLDNNPLWEDE